ncbi:MAG: hypothetical protein JWR42_1461 [Marmoricola sp.]|nr:hypothetical protein [Marmoricola sp.]
MTPDRAVDRAGGGLLWGRALVLSTVAWTTGALAHVEADGILPGPLTVLALLLGGAALAAPLLRRPASTARTCVLLVLGQLAVHLALSLTAGHGGEHGTSGMPGMHGGPLDHPGMLAAHLLAAAACGWWLARGERALWIVLGLAGRAWLGAQGHVLGAVATLRRVLVAGRPDARAPMGSERRAHPGAHPGPWTPVLHLPARSVSRRGPPTAPAVA